MASPDEVLEWNYSYDAAFSDPVYSPQTIRHGEELVALDPRNIQPRGSFAEALGNEPASQTKIIYTLRHGHTLHNEDSVAWGKNIAWRYLSRLQKNLDPPITKTGIADAILVSQYLSDMVGTNLIPRPVTVYSSPLRRCIETSMFVIKNSGLNEPSAEGDGPPVTLRVKEGLREWMGYGHGHNSDRHGSRAEIQALVEDLKAALGVNISCQLDVPEQDELHDETYTDVDQRVRGVLNDIFDDASSGSCVMLVLHGRSNKSFLRVLGHPPGDVGEFEIDNCVVLPYGVTRRLLDGREAAERAARESAQKQLDQDEAEGGRRETDDQAVQQVIAWRADPKSGRLDDLWRFLQFYEDNGDPAARDAMALLEGDLCESQG
ncbi:hypothetical protein DHEL01_v207862 [Diaporthe helianthi]|uniref:Phosphoglycerate mutase n=1 Tax=Diaporthe helianthi TaxID=158607 RepID=A0A2P5HU18_DIAHE|nr:hypothetical protein DHEL01_v207862 [Diaporthe helianthi]